MSVIHSTTNIGAQTYGQLPEGAKKELDNLYEFKEFLRKFIEDTKRSHINQLSDLKFAAHKNQTDTLTIETNHERLLQRAEILRGEVRDFCIDSRRYGFSGIQQLQPGLSSPNLEKIPIQFYSSTVDAIESRLTLCQEEVAQLDLQLGFPTEDKLGSHKHYSCGTYGHRSSRLAPQQVTDLIRNQNEAFIRLAALVASTHKQVALVKEAYTASIPTVFGRNGNSSEDPFVGADLRAASGRRLREREKQRQVLMHTTPTASVSSNGSGSNVTTPTASFGTAMSLSVQAPVGGGLSGGLSGMGTAPTTQGFGLTSTVPTIPNTTAISNSTFGFGSTNSTSSFSTMQAPSFGTQSLQQTSAAGDLVTPSFSQKLSSSSDRLTHKKKAGSRAMGSGKH